MDHRFSILHISDAHLGHPRHSDNRPLVLDRFLADLGRVREAYDITPRLIVFSGDIVYGKLPDPPLGDQYRIAEEWIARIYEVLGASRGSVPLLFVPGNHDVNQDWIGIDQREWIAGLREDSADKVYDEMQRNGQTWQRIVQRHKEWCEFVQPYMDEGWEFDKNWVLTTRVLSAPGRTIGIAGLNSSWASAGDGISEKGRLWLGRLALEKTEQKLAEANFRIIVTHHPTSWLHPADAAEVAHRIESSFDLHLHGHDHDQWYKDSRGHLRVAAGPCYAGSSRGNGYSWICIDFESHIADIILRECRSDGSGVWGPRNDPVLTDNDGVGKAMDFLQPRQGVHRGNVLNGTQLGVGPATTNSGRATTSAGDVDPIQGFIDTLGEKFSFRWEPHTFQGSGEKSVLVYWPVRLRPPTPIHAVQSFAAAGLQQLGAHVVLYLDDFGRAETLLSTFQSRIEKWFAAVKADPSAPSIQLMSQAITADNADDAWEAVQRWLGETNLNLLEVMQVSKILSRQGQSISFGDLQTKRPKSLLSPALVWACLAHAHASNPDRRIITLGGFDERTLWKAWRGNADIPSAKVGHLYVPELFDIPSGEEPSAVHMDKKNLAWDSKDDIRAALRGDIRGGGEWYSPGRLVPWCLQDCVFLPAHITQEREALTIERVEIDAMEKLELIDDPSKLTQPLADRVGRWYL